MHVFEKKIPGIFLRRSKKKCINIRRKKEKKKKKSWREVSFGLHGGVV